MIQRNPRAAYLSAGQPVADAVGTRSPLAYRPPSEETALIEQLDALLSDPTVEEIWINRPDRVFIARDGVSYQVEIELNRGDIALWVERLMMHSNRRLDLSSPFVDAMLADGSRLHVAIPDVVRDEWAVNIRKFGQRLASLTDLVARGALTDQMSILLEACAIGGYNIVVAGGTGAGKTTLLNCLIAALPPEERIITCEEVFELAVQHQDRVALQTRPANLEGAGAVSVRELVRQSLRMRPSRLVVGEVREAESLDLLLALNSGQPGMATIHANTAAEAVLKLCTLPLLAGENVTGNFVVPTVASAVDLIVQVARDHRGLRRITEIAALTGRVIEQTPELLPIVRLAPPGWQVLSADLPKQGQRHGRVDAPAIWQAIANRELARVA